MPIPNSKDIPIPTIEDKRQETSESVFGASIEPIPTITEEVEPSPVSKEEPPFVPLKNLIFEITYLADPKTKTSGLAYTETAPEFDNLGFADVKNVFGCLVLREVVLNREVVERKCRQLLEVKDFTIDCRQGILIKPIEIQPWMTQGEEETKQEFDKAVLETFRAIQTKVAQELHAAEIEKAKAEAERQLLLTKQSGHEEQVPVHRPTYILNPGDEGYNPNNDPRRRRQAVPVDSERLEDF